ncbi:MAG: aminodeoxychorismate/anthranilate synthase component II [Candidatus Palauibacterales bacterium]|nr:aminodeoxychorismate/anthranilate synthase component II [Candidatus Palauibacterales bacterium]MDP2530750.1 aminodeoxychorismate/anthranilate synthase component II [Candidatus Palauibacterales bacterium]MDP2582730.1 aminodeoxychorismate/anthranilate synthase component II [Candidatus Palauibacterales bacterium]
MILLVDNYDSFVHNLARYLRELGEEVVVRRNDAVDVAEARSLAPSHLVVSPGPCTPAEAGASCELVEALAPEVAVLGVCLGHQCIGAAFGGRVVRARRPMHGKLSPVHHGGRGLFTGLSDPFSATRYHSLVVERATLPPELEVTAWTEDGEIMALRHRDLPVWGVQFHPEAVLTDSGHRILANFLALGRGREPGAGPALELAAEITGESRPGVAGSGASA